MIRTLTLTCGAIIVTACQTIAAPVPAVLKNDSFVIPASVKTAVIEALGDSNIRIAGDSLTRSSQLILQSGPHNPEMMGDRRIPKADYFDLELRGAACVLVYRKTSKAYPLGDVNCVPAN